MNRNSAVVTLSRKEWATSTLWQTIFSGENENNRAVVYKCSVKVKKLQLLGFNIQDTVRFFQIKYSVQNMTECENAK